LSGVGVEGEAEVQIGHLSNVINENWQVAKSIIREELILK
jgi:hypothetical protein